MNYAIDLTPVWELGGTLLAALLSVLAGWALQKLGAKWKLEGDAQVRAYLNQAIVAGINYGIEHVTRKGGSLASLRVRDAATAQAANYVLRRVPEAAKKFGLTEEAVKELIEARLPAVATEPPSKP